MMTLSRGIAGWSSTAIWRPFVMTVGELRSSGRTRVSSLPVIEDQPGAWGDSYLWVLPAAPNEDTTARAAALRFVKYVYDNIGAWARALAGVLRGCLEELRHLGRQPEPIPGVHNTPRVQSPGAKAAVDPAQWQRLEDYVSGILDRFADGNSSRGERRRVTDGSLPGTQRRRKSGSTTSSVPATNRTMPSRWSSSGAPVRRRCADRGSLGPTGR
jgi:hypothetical protein